MNCHDFQEKILQGEVVPGLLSHLGACRVCRGFIRLHDRILTPAVAPQVQPAVELDEAILRAARERLALAPAVQRPRLTAALLFRAAFRTRSLRFAAAAVFVVGLILTGWLTYTARQTDLGGAVTAPKRGTTTLAWNYDPPEVALLAADVRALERRMGGSTAIRGSPSLEDELDRCAIELLLQEEEGTPEA